MRKNIVIAFVLAVCAIPAFAQKQPSTPATATSTRSNWVKSQIAWFEGEGNGDHRVAFSRPFAWGTSTYLGRRVEWFAYSNSDAWLQFNISVALQDEDLVRLATIKDREGRAWECKVNPSTNNGPATATWIGSTNDWTEEVCVKPNYTPCDGRKAVDGYLSTLNSQLKGRLTLKTVEYLQ